MNGSRGSALFLILIGIAIFAALAYAVTESLRVSEGVSKGLSEDRAKLEMSSVMNFMQAVKSGFQQMKLNGRDPQAITFEAPGDAGYGVAPHDLKLFHPEGGNVTFTPVWETIDDTSEATATDWSFVRNTIDGLGGTGTETIAALVRVPQKLCEQINLGLNGATTIPAAVGDMDSMFVTAATPITAANCASCEGVPALCVEKSGVRVFYYVLDRG